MPGVSIFEATSFNSPTNHFRAKLGDVHKNMAEILEGLGREAGARRHPAGRAAKAYVLLVVLLCGLAGGANCFLFPQAPMPVSAAALAARSPLLRCTGSAARFVRSAWGGRLLLGGAVADGVTLHPSSVRPPVRPAVCGFPVISAPQRAGRQGCTFMWSPHLYQLGGAVGAACGSKTMGCTS